MAATVFSEEIFEQICELISTTSMGLRQVCNSDTRFPTARTFYRWLDADVNLRHTYARAKEEQADFLAQEMLEISDETGNDTITVHTDAGDYEKPNHEWIARSKLRVDTRKFLASKLYPKKYGDKVDVTSDNKALVTTPAVVNVNFRDYSKKNPKKDAD